MWFLCLAFCDIWGDVVGGEGWECAVVSCHNTSYFIFFSFRFSFRKFAEIDFGFVLLFDAEQNNFPKISETSCLPQKFSIYCSFVLRTFLQTCFRIFCCCCIYFNMWFISDENFFIWFFWCKGLKWLKEKKLSIREKNWCHWRRLKFFEFIEKANLRLNLFKYVGRVMGGWWWLRNDSLNNVNSRVRF